MSKIFEEEPKCLPMKFPCHFPVWRSLSLSLSLSLYLFPSLSLSLSLSLSISLALCLHGLLCQSIWLSLPVFQSISVSAYITVSISASVYFVVCLSIHLFFRTIWSLDSVSVPTFFSKSLTTYFFKTDYSIIHSSLYILSSSSDSFSLYLTLLFVILSLFLLPWHFKGLPFSNIFIWTLL